MTDFATDAEWIGCPYYAVLEADGGGWYIAQCERLEGHDDSHHHPDVHPGFIDWTHPDPAAAGSA